MKFGALPTRNAEGAILVHSIRAGRKLFRKGRVLTRKDLDALREAGLEEVTVARLDPTDVGENELLPWSHRTGSQRSANL